MTFYFSVKRKLYLAYLFVRTFKYLNADIFEILKGITYT